MNIKKLKEKMMMEESIASVELAVGIPNMKTKIKLIYIAGKYRAENAFELRTNIQTAETKGAGVIIDEAYKGYFPIIPHLNTQYMDGLRNAQYFLDGTMEMLKRCDAIYMMKKWEESEGSVKELEWARDNGLEVYYE